MLDNVFHGAKPTKTYSIAYPRKIAVIFVFSHVVVCGTCSAPSNASLPRGRVVRISFNRRTHAMTNAFQFCEIHGLVPPRSVCLRR